MKKFLCLTSLILMSIFTIWAQDFTTLTFTAKQENDAFQKLDSVLVTNVTKGWTEILAYPDTLLKLSTDGIHDYYGNDGSVRLYQNTPNPFQGKTDFRMTLNSKEKVNLVIFDLNGRKVAEYNNTLAAGDYTFRASLSSPQTYLLSAVTKAGTTSIKLINMGSAGEDASIQLAQSAPIDMFKAESKNAFNLGDNMKYVGYATQNDGSHNVTVEKQLTGDETIIFVFPTEVFEPEITVTTTSHAFVDDSLVELQGAYTIKNAEIASLGFEYKKTADSVFSTVECKDFTSPFSATLKNLVPATEYVFAAYLKTTTDSVVRGNEATFTIPMAKPEVKTVSVDKIGSTSAVVTSLLLRDGGAADLQYGVKVTNDELKFDSLYLSTDLKEGSFTTNVSSLTKGTKYFAQAYAKNEAGEAFGEKMEFTTTEGFACGDMVKDANDNEYNTVLIGEQCWMKENIRATRYDDGTEITSGFKASDDPEMGPLVYYSWAVATKNSTNGDIHNNKVQGICPKGWHVPCYDDWNALCKTADPSFKDVTNRGSSNQEFKSENGLAIKLSAPKAWVSCSVPNTPGYYSFDPTGFNTTGFSALPTGYAKDDGSVFAPGSCHFWTAVKGSSQGDVFKIVAAGTGITWQWNMNAQTYCGVRCVMDSENGGGEIDDPADTISLDGKHIIFSEQKEVTYQIYDITNPDKAVWEWSPRTNGGYSTFNNPSDVKPVYNGTCIMAVASGGGAVIVRLKDKKVLFYANPAGNPHSIELLPNNRVVVASSTGNKLTVYDIDTTRNMKTPATAVYTMPFDCGHNVVWDEGRKCLWSAGEHYLEKIAYNESDGKLTSVDKYEFPEGNHEAHDFIKIYGKDLYYMTTVENTFIFDPNNNTFKLCEPENHASVNVKSISSGPEDYPTICAIPMAGYGTANRTWVTNKVIDFNTGKTLMEIPKAEIYKLRWWVWEK